jgi:hypothetical protein
MYVMALSILFSISGCTHLLNQAKDTRQSRSASQPEDIYSREITKLEKIAKKSPNSSRAGRAHLRLAELYLNHNNYRRNYHKAHKHMQAYVRLEKNITDEDTLNWVAALREIVLLSHEVDSRNKQIARMQGQLKKAHSYGGAVKRSNRALKQKEVELLEKNASLEATNQKLRQTIEMLKHLDSRLEEKRKNLSN